MFSAVILSANPVTRVIPGVTVVEHVGEITSVEELLDARYAAIAKVTTPWFFFLDDDDELPFDYQRILDLCEVRGAPLMYTNELVNVPGQGYLRRQGTLTLTATVAGVPVPNVLYMTFVNTPSGNFGYGSFSWDTAVAAANAPPFWTAFVGTVEIP